TGFGATSYSILEQGKIDVLLQASNSDRRVVFEEAAGISKYRIRKAEALRALLREAQWLTDAQPVVPTVADQNAESYVVEKSETNEKSANDAISVVTDEDLSSFPAAPAGPVLSEPQVPEYVWKGNTVTITRGARTYRLRGLFANKSDLALKTNIRASHGEAIFADSVDLYQDRARQRFQRAAAAELELHEDVLRHDTAVVFRVAEEALAAHRAEQAAAKAAAEASAIPEMTPDERAAALELLRSPHLLNQIADDVTACGLVGEKVNKLTCYLAATSRLLDDPLGVIIQSSSAAGKSSLMDAVLKMMPDEAVTAYSAMTEQSLFYQGEDALRHQILAIAEEAGAGKIAYSLKILISDHHLTIASPRQNPDTGCFETINYRVNGPTAVLMTTTADDDDLDPELLNRCLVMSVDESADQTAAILTRQRERCTLDGLAAADAAAAIRQKHHHAQRLLQPLRVVIPQAPQLTFATHLPRLRRDHMKYINLIRCVALLHQFQRDVFTHESGFKYIKATAEDIAAANELIAAVLGRSLTGLLPQTRAVLDCIDAFVQRQADAQKTERSAVRFLRRELREHSHLSDARLKVHLRRLVDLEILSALKTPNGSLSYALHYTVADRQRDVLHLNLLSAASIVSDKPGSRIASGANRIAPGSGADRAQIGGGSPKENTGKSVKNGEIMILPQDEAQPRHYGGDVSSAVPPATIIDAPAAPASPTSRGEGAA
ncbi:MAG: hypothetical protein MJH10_15795, partial [Epibacterium sp.]|nr:hypothetical protein [Epibacterium sp.]